MVIYIYVQYILFTVYGLSRKVISYFLVLTSHKLTKGHILRKFDKDTKPLDFVTRKKKKSLPEIRSLQNLNYS